MKTLKALLFCSTISTAVLAQNCPDNFLGTKTLYPTPHEKYAPVPAGYSPVFINHVGRHGARHLTKEVKIAYAYQLLQKADSAGALTEKGQLLKTMILRLEKVEGVDTKSISDEGRTELQDIARRMYAQNKNVFANTVNLNVGITKEIRTKQSADAFLGGLKDGLKSQPTINQYNDDTNLRFYDTAPAYKAFEEAGPYSPIMEALEKSEHITDVNKALANRIFKADFTAKRSAQQLDKFTSDVFGFTTIVYSLKSEIARAGFNTEELNFKSFFTCDELYHLGQVDVADDFYKKGPGMDLNGIQVRIAVPLLINFIKTTDEFIAGGKYTAQLRFAHAETIIPFSALLGIEAANKSTKDLTRINKDWQAAQVAPLSSNIQWILYKKANSSDYLVKILLNEKEARIAGLKTATYPYYKWGDLKAFYTKKLNDYGVKMDDDMNKYLKEIAQK
ncbi:histidine-type phosphatase [Mucilaginibacter jinjuensis]|uniref:Multiple inositol polyphosphate phosphatase 1 n=1 Tax=Mucilaginibacter jinjuensis TaxID=1176721 RepID=A0ABY7TF51_9SPHI|nr:histidine-type phosphatase [Mucilaginibacter jinjuensis]WCT14635.1 histidine-type phosphatase [Mucilaginibacter jinjuensis]